ncbi:MAG: DMT family transporter [Pseudomonadota bacterium]
MTPNLRGALLALAAFGFYATHDVVVKILGEYYSSFQIIFFSGVMGFPLITVLLLSDRTDGTLIPRHPWWSMLRSVSATATGVMGFFAFSKLPLAQCYAIFFAMPLLITLMAIPMLGEKVGIRRGMAVLVGLIGVIIVLRPGSAPLDIGHLAALGAAFAGALSSVIVRKIGQEERSVVLMLYPMVFSFFAMGLMMPFVYVPMPIEHLGLTAVIAVLGALGAMLSIAAYRVAPTIIVAPMQYSQIIWAAIYGWLFFNEGIDQYTAVGTTVIIASGIYIVLREGTPSVSQNRPVLENRSRMDTGTLPRIGLWLRMFDRRRARE